MLEFQVTINRKDNIKTLKLRVYASDNNDFPGESDMVYERDIYDEIHLGEWQVFFVDDNNIVIQSGKNYWIGYDIDFYSGNFCSVDAATYLPSMSNVVVDRDGNWVDLGDWGMSGLDGDWTIQALIEDFHSGIDGDNMTKSLSCIVIILILLILLQ